METRTGAFIFACASLAAGAAAADVTFFETENFGGRRLAIDRPAPNFGAVGFNNRAQSAIVEGGSWEVCRGPDFGGGCTVFAAGRYPTLGALAGEVSSARPVLAAPPSAPRSAVTFYESENFVGRQFTANEPLATFTGTRFNDRAQSAVVEGGPWEICVDAEFRGDCRVFAPGQYPSLAGLSGRVSSARPLQEPRGDRARGRARATLYSRPDMGGRPFPLGTEGASNLNGMFNDRALSLRVETGYWIFCSDADFQGECLTFGPGDYPTLPPQLEGRISSGRRIANDYPYARAPNWR